MLIAERCVAVIPCLNEANTIAGLVASVLGSLGAVIVVDDGSDDETATRAADAGAIVLRHEESAGKGSALTWGFRKARELGYSWAIALDGDGQHNPAEIPLILDRAQLTGARMVIGNRLQNASGMPRLRRCVNRWMSQRLSTFCGSDWPDTQCGFRLVNLESWAQNQWRAAHFEIESELLVRFAAAGHRIEFVPIETRYAGEQSKIRPLRDTWRWFKWWRAIKREFAGSNADLFEELRATVTNG